MAADNVIQLHDSIHVRILILISILDQLNALKIERDEYAVLFELRQKKRGIEKPYSLDYMMQLFYPELNESSCHV